MSYFNLFMVLEFDLEKDNEYVSVNAYLPYVAAIVNLVWPYFELCQCPCCHGQMGNAKMR